MNLELVPKVLDDLREVVGKEGLGEFCLIQGTLLGAYRGGKIIEWDHDIDLVLVGSTMAKFNRLFQFLDPLGYKLREFMSGAFFSASKEDVIVDIGKGVFKENLFVLDNPLVTDKYPRELFDTFSTIELYGKSYLAPSSVEEYLRLCYGEHWREPRDFDTDHDNLFERVWKI